MFTHVRARSVLVSDAAVLERIGLAARTQARQRTFQALTSGMTETERMTIDGLLVTDLSIHRSRFAWLRDAPEAPAPTNMVGLLDRLDWVCGVGIARERTALVHPARLACLVEEGGTDHVPHLRLVGEPAAIVQGPRQEGLGRPPGDVMFKGAYRNDDVVRLMDENHVIVVPSLWWENAPLVIDEAQTAGCTILGSDLGGIGEKLRTATNSRTFGYNDADDLIAIQRLDQQDL